MPQSDNGASVNLNPRFDLLRDFLGLGLRDFGAVTRSKTLPVLILHIPQPDGSARVVEFTGPEMMAQWEKGAVRRNAR